MLNLTNFTGFPVKKVQLEKMTDHEKKKKCFNQTKVIKFNKKKRKKKGSTKLTKNEELRKKWKKMPPVDILGMSKREP